MKYTADTGFLIELSNANPKALDVWKEITKDKGKLIIPAPVIVEAAKRLLQKGKNAELQQMLLAVTASEKFGVCDLTFELAKDAGRLACAYNISAVDGCVLATAIATGFNVVLTTDTAFRRAKKDGKIDLVEFL